jgi:hypothetical protein
MTRRAWFVTTISLLLAASCSPGNQLPADTVGEATEGTVPCDAAFLTFSGAGGEWSSESRNGHALIRQEGLVDLIGWAQMDGLQAAVEIVDAAGAHVVGTHGTPFSCQAEVGEDGCPATALRCTQTLPPGIEVTWRIDVTATFRIRVTSTFRNTSAAAVTVRRVFPFLANPETAPTPLIPASAPWRVLQNGTDEFVDYYVNLIPATTPLTDWTRNALLLGGTSSYSSGSALLFDPEGGASALVGFAGPEWAVPLVAVGREGDGGHVDHLSAELRFPKPTELPPGAELSGGTALFYLSESTPFDALEAYADDLAAYHDVHLPALPQSGWDSWYTPRGTDLDQAYIAENAAALARLFGPWGLASQQIDWGWQDNWGDWNANDRFPAGLAAAAASIADDGLKPELWIAPFSANSESDVWKEHPDWFAAKDTYGKVLAGEDQHPFDLAKPEVLLHLRSLGRRVADWGFESVKMDFGYYALLTDRPADWQATPTRLYRDGLRAFREGVGKDPYFINIAMAVQNYGLVDALRIGLDTWPCWEGGAACEHNAGGMGAQGVKPMVRMTARRYWLNGRVWWNHNDQVFVRDLSLDEQRAWATLAAVAGGMISLGEDATTLTEYQADVYRRILPLSNLTGRPLDLFEREFPEVWVQRQEEPPGAVVALFNWGTNTDLTTLPYTARPEGLVTHAVDLAALGLGAGTCLAHEFWTQETTTVKGTLAATVPPHSVRVYRVIPQAPGQLVGTDRHVLMGPGVVRDVRVVEDTGPDGEAQWAIEADVRVAPGVPMRTWWLPAGTTEPTGCVATLSGVTGLHGSWDCVTGLCDVGFVGAASGWSRLRLQTLSK